MRMFPLARKAEVAQVEQAKRARSLSLSLQRSSPPIACIVAWICPVRACSALREFARSDETTC